jgi:circadian clock protein KaiB
MKKFILRLYVAGQSANSLRAKANLECLCADKLQGQCEIHVIDVLLNPQAALEDQVHVMPALVKVLPEPRCTILGDLSHTAAVLSALGLH